MNPTASSQANEFLQDIEILLKYSDFMSKENRAEKWNEIKQKYKKDYAFEAMEKEADIEVENILKEIQKQ